MNQSDDSSPRLEALSGQLSAFANALPALVTQTGLPTRYEQRSAAARRSPAMEIGREHAESARRHIDSINDSLRQIAKALNETFPAMPTEDLGPASTSGAGYAPSLGRVVLRLEERPFLRGFVECRETVIIAPDLPESVFQFLLAIPGISDQLQRENHGHWGYHYHYVDARSRRSDTLLTFDQPTTDPNLPTLLWERHAERKGVKARARTWGPPKRESIYWVCYPDTERWNLSVFKRPSADAAVVWP